MRLTVTPAEAGVTVAVMRLAVLDSCLRRNDGEVGD
jgi:hypothetical protein